MKQLLLLFFAVLVLISCKKASDEPPHITAETIAGKWAVTSYSYKFWYRGELRTDSLNDGLGEEFEYIPQNTVIYRSNQNLEVPGTYTVRFESGKYIYDTEIPGTSQALNSGIGEIRIIDETSFQITFKGPPYKDKDNKWVFIQTLKRK